MCNASLFTQYFSGAGMKLITQSELAKIISEKTGEPFSRQAVNKSLEEGRIPFVVQGKKKLVDLDDKNIQGYIKDVNRQREQAKKNGSPSEKSKGNEPDIEGLSSFELKQRKELAQTRIQEIKADHLSKKNLPTKFIEGCYLKYIERLHSVIERVASTGIQDIGSEILSAGEVRPEHIEKFTNLFLEAMDTNKKAVAKEVDKYEPL